MEKQQIETLVLTPFLALSVISLYDIISSKQQKLKKMI